MIHIFPNDLRYSFARNHNIEHFKLTQCAMGWYGDVLMKDGKKYEILVEPAYSTVLEAEEVLKWDD